ncbi:YidH family protein [Modestobacter versicolor]|uniref:YidH family protein n=1 Tax=Modestobacter versicolor TaxID=429133 RepID=UPI0034DF4A04
MSSQEVPPSPQGHPDYRFSLANERTLLAWLRTALALVAGGVAMTQFVPELGVPAGGPVVSLGLLLGGLGTALAGHRRYVRNERAIAADQPLPASALTGWVTGLVAAVVLALLVLVVVEVVRR